MALAADSPASGLKKAMPALSGECLKETGPNGWRKPAVKEDGSVSNSSSSTTTGCEPSVCEESEATKVARDGSGSSSGSRTETVKAYKESTQDESSSSASRSEQAQDVQDGDPPKQLNSLKTAGPMESVGSVGHPNNCKPCAFYCFSLCGCRMDRDCAYCHLFHQSRLKQRREDWKRAQRQRRSRQMPKTSEPAALSAAAVQRPGVVHRDVDGSLPNGFGEAQPSFNAMAPPPHPPQGYVSPVQSSMPPGLVAGNVEPPANNSSALEGLIQQVSLNTALLRSLLPMLEPQRLSNVPAAQKLASLLADPLQAEAAAAVLGGAAYSSSSSMSPPPPMSLQDHLPESLLNQTSMDFFEYKPNSLEVFVGQMVELWPPVSHLRGCLFAAAPRLPLGVTLDERSGLVHGRPQEPTQGQVNYFVTACNPARFPPTVSVALIKLTVNYAFDVWPH